MKKFLLSLTLALAVLATCFSIAACGGNDDKDDKKDDGNVDVSELEGTYNTYSIKMGDFEIKAGQALGDDTISEDSYVFIFDTDGSFYAIEDSRYIFSSDYTVEEDNLYFVIDDTPVTAKRLDDGKISVVMEHDETYGDVCLIVNKIGDAKDITRPQNDAAVGCYQLKYIIDQNDDKINVGDTVGNGTLTADLMHIQILGGGTFKFSAYGTVGNGKWFKNLGKYYAIVETEFMVEGTVVTISGNEMSFMMGGQTICLEKTNSFSDIEVGGGEEVDATSFIGTYSFLEAHSNGVSYKVGDKIGNFAITEDFMTVVIKDNGEFIMKPQNGQTVTMTWTKGDAENKIVINDNGNQAELTLEDGVLTMTSSQNAGDYSKFTKISNDVTTGGGSSEGGNQGGNESGGDAPVDPYSQYYGDYAFSFKVVDGVRYSVGDNDYDGQPLDENYMIIEILPDDVLYVSVRGKTTEGKWRVEDYLVVYINDERYSAKCEEGYLYLEKPDGTLAIMFDKI